MVCVNCGKNLIRGYAFCLECGSAAPPEALEQGGMPGRSDNEGKPMPEAPKPPKKENDDETEKPASPASEVRSSMPGVEPLGGGTAETLVFCPNCGMHMQSDPFQCNKCGMYLGDKPKNVPLSPGGVPLMNMDEMSVGGLGGFDSGLGDISDSEIDRINGFMNGAVPIFAEEDNSSPDLFGGGISANDFAQLSQQLASFSAANDMPSIEAIEHEPKKKPVQKGSERQIDNFSMGDDVVSAVPLTDNSVSVVENYSMDEYPAENVDLDPYKFLDNSLDDAPEPLFSNPAPTVLSEPVGESVPTVPSAAPKMPEFEPIFSKDSAPVRPEPIKQPELPKQTERVEFEPIFGSSAGSAPSSVRQPEPAKQPEPPKQTERVEFEPIFGSSAGSAPSSVRPPEPAKQPEPPKQTERVEFEPIFGSSAGSAPSSVRQPEPVKQPEPPKQTERVEFEPIFGSSAGSAPSSVRQPEPAKQPEPPKQTERVEFEPIFGSSAGSAPSSVRQSEPAKQPEPPKQTERVQFEPIFGSSAGSAPSPVRQPEPSTEHERPVPPVYTPPAEEAPFIAETSPVINEVVSPPASNAPSVPRQELPRGNMFRCRQCGNVMYDTDRFCPSCGVSYKNSTANPQKKSKAPLFIVIAAAVILAAAGGFFALNALNGGASSSSSIEVSVSGSTLPEDGSEPATSSENAAESDVSTETF